MAKQRYFEVSIITAMGACRGHIHAKDMDVAIDRLTTAFSILNIPLEQKRKVDGQAIDRRSETAFLTEHTGTELTILLEELDTIEVDPGMHDEYQHRQGRR